MCTDEPPQTIRTRPDYRQGEPPHFCGARPLAARATDADHLATTARWSRRSEIPVWARSVAISTNGFAALVEVPKFPGPAPRYSRTVPQRLFPSEGTRAAARPPRWLGPESSAPVACITRTIGAGYHSSRRDQLEQSPDDEAEIRIGVWRLAALSSTAGGRDRPWAAPTATDPGGQVSSSGRCPRHVLGRGSPGPPPARPGGRVDGDATSVDLLLSGFCIG